jgi:hypothetical protein
MPLKATILLKGLQSSEAGWMRVRIRIYAMSEKFGAVEDTRVFDLLVTGP